MMLTPNGLSVMVLTLWISSRSQSAFAFIAMADFFSEAVVGVLVQIGTDPQPYIVSAQQEGSPGTGQDRAFFHPFVPQGQDPGLFVILDAPGFDLLSLESGHKREPEPPDNSIMCV